MITGYNMIKYDILMSLKSAVSSYSPDNYKSKNFINFILINQQLEMR